MTDPDQPTPTPATLRTPGLNDIETPRATHYLYAWFPHRRDWRHVNSGTSADMAAAAIVRHEAGTAARRWGEAFTITEAGQRPDGPPDRISAVWLVTEPESARYGTPPQDPTTPYRLYLWTPESRLWREISHAPFHNALDELERRFNAAHSHGMNEWAYTLRPADAGPPTGDPDEHMEVWIVEVKREAFAGFRPGLTATRPSWRRRDVRAGDVQPGDVILLEDHEGLDRWRLVIGVYADHTPYRSEEDDEIPDDVARVLDDAFRTGAPATITSHLCVFHLSADRDGNQVHTASWFDLITAQEAVL